MARACEAAFAQVPGLRDRIDRLSVVDIMTPTGRRRPPSWPTWSDRPDRRSRGHHHRWQLPPVAGQPGRHRHRRRSVGGDGDRRGRGHPLVAGPAGRRDCPASKVAPDLAPDPVVGDDQPGVGPAESAIGLLAPVHVYPLFESVVAARAGQDAAGPTRRAMGELLAPFTRGGRRQSLRLVPDDAYRPDGDRHPEPRQPHRLRAVHQADDRLPRLRPGRRPGGLLAGRRPAGRGGRPGGVRLVGSRGRPTCASRRARPDPGRSPAIAAAGRALFDAASAAAGPGGDDRGRRPRPSSTSTPASPPRWRWPPRRSGSARDDHRGLTVTGGLPYFGGPGNNYTTHGIATLTDRLRESQGAGPTRLGLATGLGWFVTKHALGLYGTTPPPGGFRRGDTTADQAGIDASAVEVALEVDAPTRPPWWRPPWCATTTGRPPARR